MTLKHCKVESKITVLHSQFSSKANSKISNAELHILGVLVPYFFNNVISSYLSIGYNLPPCLNISNKPGVCDLKIHFPLHIQHTYKLFITKPNNSTIKTNTDNENRTSMAALTRGCFNRNGNFSEKSMAIISTYTKTIAIHPQNTKPNQTERNQRQCM